MNIETLKTLFRVYRKNVFKAFDIYKSNVNYGVESEDSAQKTEIINWYNDMKSFTDTITINTTEEDYPILPNVLKNYLN